MVKKCSVIRKFFRLMKHNPDQFMHHIQAFFSLLINERPSVRATPAKFPQHK